MKLFYFVILTLFSFDSSVESQSPYLEKVAFFQTYNLGLYYNTQPRLVEIFNPFKPINIKLGDRTYSYVLQASFIIPRYRKENIVINSNDFGLSTFWYRITILPSISDNVKFLTNFNLQVSRNDYSYLSVTFENITSIKSSLVKYNLWAFPIFPSGQFASWSKEYSDKIGDMIIPAINDSSTPNLINKGKLLAENIQKLSVTVADRSTYTYLLIIQAMVDQDLVMQFSPVIIYGCLSQTVLSSTESTSTNNILSPTDSCRLLLSGYWFTILCVMVAFSILFILLGHIKDLLQLCVSAWITLVFVGCIIYHYAYKNIYTIENILYIIVFAAALGVDIFLLVFCRVCCKKKKRLHIIFNVITIILIVTGIVWFAMENMLMNLVFTIPIMSAIALLLFCSLIACHEFTSTLGSVFIGISFMSYGFSLLTINASTIPYLILDFFNFILNRKSNVYYYSLFLYNDLIILICWGVLTLAFGIICYDSKRKRNSTIRSRTPEQVVDSVMSPISSNNTPISQVNINVYATHNATPYAPPSYSQLPTAPVMADEPPPYPGIS